MAALFLAMTLYPHNKMHAWISLSSSKPDRNEHAVTVAVALCLRDPCPQL